MAVCFPSLSWVKPVVPSTYIDQGKPESLLKTPSGLAKAQSWFLEMWDSGDLNKFPTRL